MLYPFADDAESLRLRSDVDGRSRAKNSNKEERLKVNALTGTVIKNNNVTVNVNDLAQQRAADWGEYEVDWYRWSFWNLVHSQVAAQVTALILDTPPQRILVDAGLSGKRIAALMKKSAVRWMMWKPYLWPTNTMIMHTELACLPAVTGWQFMPTGGNLGRDEQADR